VVEDAHWVDPTSLEFMSLLVERASSMRLLLVIVARPEFVPPWPEYSYMMALAVPRLSHADSTVLIQQVAGDSRIADHVEADIIGRANGVPLFVEELTKSILENTSSDENGRALGASTTVQPRSRARCMDCCWLASTGSIGARRWPRPARLSAGNFPMNSCA
jgi:hypothetical protein